MTKPSRPSFTPRNLAVFGQQRARDLAFNAVHQLWRRRRKQGWTQEKLAARLGKDAAWVSRTLKAPGNWTMATFGALAVALEGEMEIRVHGLEDPLPSPANFDAYAVAPSLPETPASSGTTTTARMSWVSPMPATAETRAMSSGSLVVGG